MIVSRDIDKALVLVLKSRTNLSVSAAEIYGHYDGWLHILNPALSVASMNDSIVRISNQSSVGAESIRQVAFKMRFYSTNTNTVR